MVMMPASPAITLSLLIAPESCRRRAHYEQVLPLAVPLVTVDAHPARQDTMRHTGAIAGAKIVIPAGCCDWPGIEH